MIKCSSCGNEISPKAATCPKCGHPNEVAKKVSNGKAVWSLVVFGAIAWFVFGGGAQKQVASDFTKQYDIAKSQGDPIQICVQAGFVSAAYLAAKDDAQYKSWKEIEKKDCQRAGVPR